MPVTTPSGTPGLPRPAPARYGPHKCGDTPAADRRRPEWRRRPCVDADNASGKVTPSPSAAQRRGVERPGATGRGRQRRGKPRASSSPKASTDAEQPKGLPDRMMYHHPGSRSHAERSVIFSGASRYRDGSRSAVVCEARVPPSQGPSPLPSASSLTAMPAGAHHPPPDRRRAGDRGR